MLMSLYGMGRFTAVHPTRRCSQESYGVALPVGMSLPLMIAIGIGAHVTKSLLTKCPQPLQLPGCPWPHCAWWLSKWWNTPWTGSNTGAITSPIPQPPWFIRWNLGEPRGQREPGAQHESAPFHSVGGGSESSSSSAAGLPLLRLGLGLLLLLLLLLVVVVVLLLLVVVVLLLLAPSWLAAAACCWSSRDDASSSSRWFIT
eukprot:COSAG06_NODE_22047_length_736_cov_1.119309_1_plen_200_part_01